MHGSDITVLLSATSARPGRNGIPLAENSHIPDHFNKWHVCTIDSKPARIDISIAVDRVAARARYQHDADMRRLPTPPPAEYAPTFYHDGSWWRQVTAPQLDNEYEWRYTFMHIHDGRYEYPRLVDCDRGEAGTGRSPYARLPYLRKPPGPDCHLEVIITALPRTDSERILYSSTILLNNNPEHKIRNCLLQGPLLRGTPLDGLRFTFRRVTSGPNRTFPQYDRNEQHFACFDFYLNDTLQEVEEAMDGVEIGEAEEEDEGEDADEAEGDEEGAVEAGAEGGEEAESSSDSTPSVAETWYDR